MNPETPTSASTSASASSRFSRPRPPRKTLASRLATTTTAGENDEQDPPPGYYDELGQRTEDSDEYDNQVSSDGGADPSSMLTAEPGSISYFSDGMTFASSVHKLLR